MAEAIKPQLIQRGLPLFTTTESTRGRAGNAPIGVHAAASTIELAVIPLAALLMINLSSYAALVSFASRPNTGGRLLPAFGVFILGIILGGVVQRLPTWRLALAAGPVAALVAVLPGLHHYVFNEPLRVVANFTFGLSLASAYRLFFSRFPTAWRGTAFGACLGAGLLCWNVLASLAHAGLPMGDAAFHPVLRPVFYIHAAAIAILAALCLVASFTKTEELTTRPHFVPVTGWGNSGRLVRSLLMAVAAVYTMSGILDAKLTPMISASPQRTFPIVLTLLAAVAAPFGGWLLDRHPERLFRHILPACCWLFILAPSLSALGYEHQLHSLLQSVAASAQFIFFVLCSIAVAGLAPDAATAAFHACLVYAMRFVALPVNVLWTRTFAAESGTTIVAATILALMAGSLIRRARFTVARPEGNLAEPLRVEPASPVAPLPVEAKVEEGFPGTDVNHMDSKTIPKSTAQTEAFLAPAGLTPREQETAVLLLGGKSGVEIAAELGIGQRMVRKHATNLYRKFGVGGRRELQRLFAESLSGTPRLAESVPSYPPLDEKSVD